jgi:hypothetical protein
VVKSLGLKYLTVFQLGSKPIVFHSEFHEIMPRGKDELPIIVGRGYPDQDKFSSMCKDPGSEMRSDPAIAECLGQPVCTFYTVWFRDGFVLISGGFAPVSR